MEYVAPVPYNVSLLYAGLSLGNYNDASLYNAGLYNGVASPAPAEIPLSYGGLTFMPREEVTDDEDAIALLMEML